MLFVQPACGSACVLIYSVSDSFHTGTALCSHVLTKYCCRAVPLYRQGLQQERADADQQLDKFQESLDMIREMMTTMRSHGG